MATPTAGQVCEAYFRAIAAHDPSRVSALFAPDAKLRTPAGTFTGPADIARFYATQVFAAGDVVPRPGPLLIVGDRVAVEIEVEIGGRTSRAADFFVVRDGLIRRLAIYLGG